MPGIGPATFARGAQSFGDEGDDECTVSLRDAADGQKLDRATALRNGPPVSLKPGAAERV